MTAIPDPSPFNVHPVINGVIALPKTHSVIFSISQLIIISSVILILTLYAFLWIDENLKFEGKIRDQLDKIFEQELNYAAYKELRPGKAKFGYKLVIFSLGAVALIATWMTCRVQLNHRLEKH